MGNTFFKKLFYYNFIKYELCLYKVAHESVRQKDLQLSLTLQRQHQAGDKLTKIYVEEAL